MNKIIFQIGALAFFVSLVAFSTERYPILDTVARAFIVFIIVTVALSSLFALAVMIASRDPHPKEETHPVNKPSQTVA
jgi:ABC-type transport system involved in cytochrome c biogenesis permease subunit